MRILILISTIILVCNTLGYPQTTDHSSIKRNSIYVEGYLVRHDFSKGFVSINYERNIGKNRKTNIRVGIYPDFESAVSFPLTVSWVTKPLSSHHFEYGIGAVINFYTINFYTKEWFYEILLMIPLMYRYQKNSGLFFRGGINLFISLPTLPSPSISVGYKF